MPKLFYHSTRFTNHTEKDFFLGQFKDGYYDAVIMNGNIVAHSPRSTSTFALKLKKHFIVDPLTHAFQHDIKYLKNDSGKIKQSLIALSRTFGSPVKEYLEKDKPIDAKVFSEENTPDFVRKVLEFQLKALSRVVEEGPLADYVSYAIKDENNELSKECITPSLLIAPYLHIEDTPDLEINQKFIDASLKFIAQKKISKELAAQLVISADTFSSATKRDKVLSIYKKISVKKIFLWIDSFKEEEASAGELKELRSFVESLSRGGKEVINLYGGYFSILLTKLDNGLAGVCHGMEYGESRGVVPIGGGVPRAMYYFYPLHKRLRRVDAARIFTGNQWDEKEGSRNPEFAKLVCGCEYCEDIPTMFEETESGYSTGDAKRQSLGHYLENKKREYEETARLSLPELLNLLEDAYQRFKKTAFEDDIKHLNRWKEALSS